MKTMAVSTEILTILGRSLLFAFLSVGFSSLAGIPLGMWIGWGESRARRIAYTLFQSLAALPTVVVGLVLYAFLSRSGPLGPMGLLYTPAGVVIGQYFLALPILVSFIAAGFRTVDRRFMETLETFGCGLPLKFVLALREGKTIIAAGVAMAFSRVIGEVGVAMMLGGNLRNSTRTMTTAIALDTSRGEFEQAMILGLILLFVALAVHWLINSRNSRGTLA